MVEYYLQLDSKRVKISEGTWYLYRSGKFSSYSTWSHFTRESNGSIVDCFLIVK